MSLSEFVSRPDHHQLWLVDDEALHQLDLDAALLQPVPVGFYVDHLNILPAQDRLVLTEVGTADVRFYDMAAGAIDSSVTLPDPAATPLAKVGAEPHP